MDTETKQARLGHITASQAHLFVSPTEIRQPRSKAAREAGELPQAAMSYLYARLGELLTGKPEETVTTKAMQWGLDHEDEALNALCEPYSRPSFIPHPSEVLIGCTPDALFDIVNSTVEAKCPYNTGVHLRTWLTHDISDHIQQIQFQLWVTDLPACMFVSYDPRLPSPHCLYRKVIGRDDFYITDVIKPGILAARDRLLSMYREITGAPL